METHKKLKAAHSEEINNFEGIFFAFNDEQLSEGLKKLGLPEDCNPSEHLAAIGAGGYILKTRVADFGAMFKRHDAENKELRKNPKELVKAIAYEMANHEYGYTGEIEDTLEALDISPGDVDKALIDSAKKLYFATSEAV